MKKWHKVKLFKILKKINKPILIYKEINNKNKAYKDVKITYNKIYQINKKIIKYLHHNFNIVNFDLLIKFFIFLIKFKLRFNLYLIIFIINQINGKIKYL
jgi:hypothetical protein